jgi:flavin-dependent dehydrogenase
VRALKNDDLSAAALSGYEREWKKRLGQEINISYQARRVFERLGDARIEGVFDIIRDRNVAEALAGSDDLSFDWHSRAVIKLARRMALPAVMGFMGLPFKKGLAKVKDG